MVSATAREQTASSAWHYSPVMLGTHYPCSPAVFIAREHGLGTPVVCTGLNQDCWHTGLLY